MVDQKFMLPFTAFAHRLILTAAAVPEPQSPLDQLAKPGAGVLKPHYQLLHAGRKDRNLYLKTIGKTVDEPLYFFIKKEIDPFLQVKKPVLF
jgi:hypothetical protein